MSALPQNSQKFEELLYTQIPQSFPMLLTTLPNNFQIYEMIRNDVVKVLDGGVLV